MKGTRLNETGELEKTNLQDNAANFKRIIDWVKTNKPETTVLREEIKPIEAKIDRAFMAELIK